MKIFVPFSHLHDEPLANPEDRFGIVPAEQLPLEACLELEAMREQHRKFLAAQESDSLDEQPNG